MKRLIWIAIVIIVSPLFFHGCDSDSTGPSEPDDTYTTRTATVTYVYDGQELQFCCAGCIPQFEKAPEKYMEKLHSMGSDQTKEPLQSEESGGEN